jgi:two-component system chemotaxis sensor kinase CheA
MAQDPYRYFRIEARELAEQLGQALLDLEKGPDAEIVARLLRLAHTLKGAARVVRRTDIADLAHALEDRLTPLRETGAPPTRGLIDELLAFVDRIALAVSGLAAPPAELVAPAPTHLPGGQLAPRVTDDEPALSARADAADLDALLDGVSEVSVQLEGVRRAQSAAERLLRLAELLEGQLAKGRRDEDSLNRALTLAEELRTLLEGFDRELGRSLEQVGRELGQVREGAERLRLLPARGMFGALERTARDAARSLRKQVTFRAEGGDVRLDMALLSAVQDALVQAVRNAVAHGIESAEARLRAGKPAAGRVTVRVERRGARNVFVCEDDGAGIDLEAVRHVLVQRGARADEVAALDREGLIERVLGGGISTSAEVSAVAGRGIGLDLIRDVAARFGGELLLDGPAGRGLRLSLTVPASLSALDVLLIETGGQTAALPLEAVQRTLRVPPGDVARTGEGTSILHEGKVIPFAPLAQALRVHSPRAAEERGWSAVVVRGSASLAAVGVDRLRGTTNLVVRPLPELLPVDPVVLGASLDAAGNPRLVLDPVELVRVVERPRTLPPTRGEPPHVLVIDDSLTTRMLEQSILESAGYRVDVAASAEEGLALARIRRYALFLVDVEMPGMDGFEFVATTRADALLRAVPAILVTSRNAGEDKARGLAAGASDYVVKSEFDQVSLLSRIRELVRAP